MVALCVAVGRAKRIRRLLDSARSQRDSNSPAVQDALTGREEMGLRYLDWVGRGLVNNWDLVDISAEHLVGAWLLLPLVQEAGDDTVARRLLDDPHDLIRKAIGWMLREAGKRVDERALVAFLDEYAPVMPRTMLRCAIERFDPAVRAHYRSRTVRTASRSQVTEP